MQESERVTILNDWIFMGTFVLFNMCFYDLDKAFRFPVVGASGVLGLLLGLFGPYKTIVRSWLDVGKSD